MEKLNLAVGDKVIISTPSSEYESKVVEVGVLLYWMSNGVAYDRYGWVAKFTSPFGMQDNSRIIRVI